MNELDIQLIVNPTCELIAVDRTSYQNLHYEYNGMLQYLRDRSKHVSIEFLTDVDGYVIHDSINLEKGLRNRMELLDGNTTVFHFPKDGTFTYYKFLVPHITHLLKKDDYSQQELFKVYDQTFFYNDEFYYCREMNDLALRDFLSWEEAVEYIIGISQKIDISDLWKYQGTQTFSFQKMLFSICKLQKCLVNLQKQIMNNPENCMECGMESSLRFKRDFLLSALYVFDYLKDTKNYEEAQRLLDNMSGCGMSLCESTDDSKVDCGCGKVIY